mgnify:CR=1 FL=1
MLKEIVEVTQVLQDNVRVKFQKSSSCSCCKVSYICNKGEETLLLDRDGFSLEKGNKVEIAIDEKKTLLANIIIFFVPVVLFIAGLVFFKGRGELLSFFLALSAVCIYYVIVKFILKSQGKKFKIKILKKV